MIKAKVNWYGRPGDWYGLSDSTKEDAQDFFRDYFSKVGGGYVNCIYEVREVPDSDIPEEENA
jgi:hypothetical protein